MELKVALIVPAFNEADRIGRVLEVATRASLVHEVIAVSDGSEDGTAQAARQVPGVRVVALPWNMGKGGAMAAGVAATDANILCFFDADLLGLEPDHIDSLIRPVIHDQADMTIGLLCQGAFCSDFGNQITPGLSGQRAMKREFFNSMPYIADLRMGVEVAFGQEAARQQLAIIKIPLEGVRNTHKEQKLGIWAGTAARLRMYRDVAEATVRVRKIEALHRRSEP